MANGADFQKLSRIKMLLCGNAGYGKTGSLASLVDAGYKLRIIDLEHNLTPLFTHSNSEFHKNIDYVSIRDKLIRGVAMTTTKSKEEIPREYETIVPDITNSPAIFSAIPRLTQRWAYAEYKGEIIYPDSYTKIQINTGVSTQNKIVKPFDDLLAKGLATDLGLVADFPKDTILVIDSLTALANSCKTLQKFLNRTDFQSYTWNEYASIQGTLERLLELISKLPCHVILIAHIREKKNENGMLQGSFPLTAGQKLDPVVGRYFDTVLLVDLVNGKRVIRTGGINEDKFLTKMPSKGMADTYPLSTGLLDLFKQAFTLV